MKMLVECNRKRRKKRLQNARLIKIVFEEVEANFDEDACKFKLRNQTL